MTKVVFSIVVVGLCSTGLAWAKSTTQACLGPDLEQAVQCPKGTKRVTSRAAPRLIQCFKTGGPRGVIPIRHGPAIWFQKDGKTVQRAGTYVHHTKVGRWYHFDKQGSLSGIEDYRDDWSAYGYRIRCDARGNLLDLTYFNKNGREQGRSFHFSHKAVFQYAKDWDDGKFKGDRDRKAKPPSSDWCQPARCTFVEKPNMPRPNLKDPTGGFEQDKKVKLTRLPKRSKLGTTY